MCTITLAWQVFEETPVLVAANRDESVGRPAEPPRRRDWGRAVIAPLDQRAGGTWIGYNEDGVVVALANRWTEATLSGERSRGLLVREALGHESAEAAIRFVERELDERDYEGFNLVAVDETAAILVEWDGVPRVVPFDPGVHVVVNVGADGVYAVPPSRAEYGSAQTEHAEAVRSALQPEPGERGRAWLDRASDVISDHDYGVCIHGDGFGTVSSSLIQVDGGHRYDFADGPPCENLFERVPETV